MGAPGPVLGLGVRDEGVLGAPVRVQGSDAGEPLVVGGHDDGGGGGAPAHPRALPLQRGQRAAVQQDAGAPGPVDGPGVNDLGAVVGHAGDRRVVDVREGARGGDQAGVGGADARDVGEELADGRAQGAGEGNRRQVGAVAAQHDGAPVRVHALAAGHHRDGVRGEGGAQRGGVGPQQLGVVRRALAEQAGARGGDRARRHPGRVEGRGEQGDADGLAAGQQHGGGRGGRVGGEVVQGLLEPAGGAGHGADHDDHRLPGGGPPGHVAGDAGEPVELGERGAAELQDQRGAHRSHPRRTAASTICRALSAAPTHRLSATIHSHTPRGSSGSTRIRPTCTAARPSSVAKTVRGIG